MKKAISCICVCICILLFAVSDAVLSFGADENVSGLSDSGLDYGERVATVKNPAMGYPSVKTIIPRLSGNSALNDSGFVQYMIDLKYFSGGYTYANGVKTPLNDEQKAMRTTNAQGFKDYAGNERNYGGAEDIPLSEDALNALKQTFANLRKNGGSCMIRPSYATNNEVYNEPCDFNILLTHIRQLSEVFTEYSDVICGVETGTFGPAGEMRSSEYCASKYVAQIIEEYLHNTPESIKFSVRTPGYVMSFINGGGKTNINFNGILKLLPINTDGNTYKASDMKRLGLFNDGYMLDGGDAGTWSTVGRDKGIEWLSWASSTTYYGGEYGSGKRSSDYWLPETAIPEMYKTHVSYIRGNIYRSNMSSVNTWVVSVLTKGSTVEDREDEAAVERYIVSTIYGIDEESEKKDSIRFANPDIFNEEVGGNLIGFITLG